MCVSVCSVLISVRPSILSRISSKTRLLHTLLSRPLPCMPETKDLASYNAISGTFFGLPPVFSRNTSYTILRLFLITVCRQASWNPRWKWRCIEKRTLQTFYYSTLAVTTRSPSMHCMVRIACSDVFYHPLNFPQEYWNTLYIIWNAS